jgi:hypothetical protein
MLHNLMSGRIEAQINWPMESIEALFEMVRQIVSAPVFEGKGFLYRRL